MKIIVINITIMMISTINSVASHCANMIATSTDVCNLLLLYCRRGKVWDTCMTCGWRPCANGISRSYNLMQEEPIWKKIQENTK